MSESFLVAAAERASGAGTDALTALMAKTGLTGGGLLDAPGFWEKESGAPLLRRNAGFFTSAGIPDALRQRQVSIRACINKEACLLAQKTLPSAEDRTVRTSPPRPTATT